MENLLDKFWFRLMLVFIAGIYITEIGSMDSLATRLKTDEFYKEYMATVLIGIVTVELIYFSHSRLEKKVPWKHGQVLHRLLLQTIWSCFVPLVLVMAMATLYFYIYGVDIRRTDYFYFIVPIVLLLIVLLNTIFIMIPVFIQNLGNRHPEHVASIDDKQTELMTIQVIDGSSVLMLEPEEVLSAYIVNGKVVIRTADHNEYVTDISLDELEKEYLPKHKFFRINRQLIASKFVCREYKVLDYNKLEVRLSTPVPVNTVVSQLKSRTFKEWIAGEH